MRKTMATKCGQNFLLVMMELLILILLNVQANDLVPTLFFPSSPPNLLPYSFDLDEAKGALHNCLTKEIEDCSHVKKTWPFTDFTYQHCIKLRFGHCMILAVFSNDPYYFIMDDCISTTCKPEMKENKPYYRSSAIFVNCLLKCYEERIKNPSDVIYSYTRRILEFQALIW